MAIAVVLGGVAFFVAAVGLTLGLAMYNARVMPAVPWFPVPVLGVLFAAVFWLNRRFAIGLALPKDRRWASRRLSHWCTGWRWSSPCPPPPRLPFAASCKVG